MDDDLPLFRLFAGEVMPPVNLCSLPSRLTDALGTSATVVWVSREDMWKIRFKHRVTARHLPMMRIALRYGWAGIEPHRPRFMSFIYLDETVFHRPFKAVVKVTGEKHELFLETFHQCKPAHLRALIRRATEHQPHFR